MTEFSTSIIAVIYFVLFMAVCIFIAVINATILTEQEKWDLAANGLQVEGYTAFEIEQLIGPRP